MCRSDEESEALVGLRREPVHPGDHPLPEAIEGAPLLRDAERVVFRGATLSSVEDPGDVAVHGVSCVGECVPMLCLEDIQDGLEDRVGVVGEPLIIRLYRVDVAVPLVRHAADEVHGLVRCVVSALSFLFLGRRPSSSKCASPGPGAGGWLVAPGGGHCGPGFWYVGVWLALLWPPICHAPGARV